MAFNAGDIEGRLTLNRTAFRAGLAQSRKEATEFAKTPVTVKIKAVADTAKADAEIAATQAAADHLDGKNVDINVDRHGRIGVVRRGIGLLGVALSHFTSNGVRDASTVGAAFSRFGSNVTSALGSTRVGTVLLVAGIAALIPAIAAVIPIAVGAGGALAGMFTAAGASAGAFAVVAKGVFGQVTDAQKKAAQLRARAAGASGKERRALLAQAAAITQHLTPAERVLGHEINTVKDAWKDTLHTLSPLVQIGVGPWLHLAVRGMRLLKPLVTPVAHALHDLGQSARDAIASPFWHRFVHLLGVIGGTVVRAAGRGIGNLARGFANLFKAFLPLLLRMLPGLVRLTKRFADWSAGLAKSKGFHQFVRFTIRNGPLLLRFFGDLVKLLIVLVKVLAPTGIAFIIAADAIVRFATVVTKWLGHNVPRAVRTTMRFLHDLTHFFTHTFPGSFIRGWHTVKHRALDPFVHFFTGTIPHTYHVTVHWLGRIAGAFARFFTGTIPREVRRGTRTFIGFFTHTIPRGWHLAVHWIGRIGRSVAHFFTHDIPRAARQGADAFGRFWQRLENKAKRPVNFVIHTVYDQGIRHLFNLAASKLGLSLRLPYVPRLAAGGMYNTPTAIVGEGNPAHPEYVIPTDPRYRGRARSLWQAAGAQLLAGGGIIGDITGWFLHPVQHLKQLLAGPLTKLDQITGEDFGRLAAAVPRRIAAGLADWVKNHIVGVAGDLAGAVSHGANVALGAVMAAGYGWAGRQFAALNRLWTRESGWRNTARNPTSGAYGIPQALPPSKMGRLANPPFSLPAAQIAWGLRYIADRYGSPLAAWAHETRAGWYDNGFGVLKPGATLAVNGTRQNEYVVDRRHLTELAGGTGKGALINGPVTVYATGSNASGVEIIAALDHRLHVIAHGGVYSRG